MELKYALLLIVCASFSSVVLTGLVDVYRGRKVVAPLKEPTSSVVSTHEGNKLEGQVYSFAGFGPVKIPDGYVPIGSPAFGEVNGDGAQDLAINVMNTSLRSGQTLLYKNTTPQKGGLEVTASDVSRKGGWNEPISVNATPYGQK